MILTLGAHHTDAGLVAKAMRTATRPTPRYWTRQPVSFESAAAALTRWANGVDLHDVDALCWIPGHDGTPGPGQPTASVLAAATGLALLDACHRTTTTTSACGGGRHHWTHHARTMHSPSRHRPQRLALVDNTIATGHTARAASVILTAAGHDVTHVLAASHTAAYAARFPTVDRHQVDLLEI